MAIPDETRQECADSALKCFGTAYIFEARARPIRKALQWLAFLGIAGPAALGGVVATFSLKKEALDFAIALAGVIGIAQLIISIWSLVAKWDDRLAYSIESLTANYRLAGEYDRLAKTQSSSPEDFNLQFRVLETEAQMRKDLDQRQGIAEREKRLGMRAGLRQYKRPCAGCKTVPVSLQSTNCSVCGQF